MSPIREALLQGIERAFAVLRALAAAEGSAGVSAVARATGLPKSTVSRILSSLEAIGVVARLDAAGSYAIGPGLAELAGSGSGPASLRDLCQPYLRDLSTEFDETSGLTVPDGATVLYVENVASDSAIQTRDWTGMRFPYHTVAGGLALMATWSDSQISEYANQGLEVYAERTVTNVDDLMRRVTIGRRYGYVWTRGDFDDEINGVASPVLDGDGRAVGAINLFGPGFRFPGDVAESEIGSRISAVAQQVTARLRSGPRPEG